MTSLEQIAIVGAACRLPGAPDEKSFAQLLVEERCVIADQPVNRWSLERFYHPRNSERGFAYTFAGGYLPDPYAFDPAVFGISPREAAQMDPQQRLLSEVVWEAFEDARLNLSAVAGTEVGVYVGVSALDHGSLFSSDPGAIESHFMTGNTLSIVANRISYLFDLRGPSFAIDTACSSSLVAVDRALSDLQAGRIDTAVVAGVNMLLSPASFIGFSRASMLSPTGRCRPFSAEGDGYVRAEGAVAFILRRSDIADPGSIRAYLSASATNSDGRTSGIALPGLDGQKALLRHVYDRLELTPDDIAFMEAHGTGTAVGDPIEAMAIGEVVGRGRSKPLPIGSVKSNIGHLEPASGVAGMMKALLALESRRLPATLHLASRNPNIDFDALNLRPAAEAIDLAPAGVLHCGVSSFGFGGTNAHVVMRSAHVAETSHMQTVERADQLVISAGCREALAALASRHAALLAGGVDPGVLASSVLVDRQLQRHRAVLPVSDASAMAKSLIAFAAGQKTEDVIVGTGGARRPRICFVYSGNGAQWVGMGRAAFSHNPHFASKFAEVDLAYGPSTGDTLTALLLADNLAERIGAAEVAQPLLFAIQVSLTHALAIGGLRPDVVLGHSVGEIAAAHSAGLVGLDDAVRILRARATCQETVRGTGLMAAFAADRETVSNFLRSLNTTDIEIAADNGSSSVTVSGGVEAVELAVKEARRNRLACRLLDIDYPYHSRRLDGIRDAFLAQTGDIATSLTDVIMMSTVLGAAVGNHLLDAEYWWKNLRNEVLFQQAVKAAVADGTELFIEIGPRPILLSPVTSSIEESGVEARAIHSLAETDDKAGRDNIVKDPVQTIIARAIANGHIPPLPANRERRVDRRLPLPLYPWQHKSFHPEHTSEALDFYAGPPRHPLIGGRMTQGTPEWRTLLDTTLVPYLADHRVGGDVVVPGTALAEMALAAAREMKRAGPIAVEDFDILQPLVLPPHGTREISVRYSDPSASIEIYSRPRFAPDEWTLHARGHVNGAPEVPPLPPSVSGEILREDPERIYDIAARSGIDYGPDFALLRSLRRDDEEVIEVKLAAPPAHTGVFTRSHILHPASLDASFHGLFDLLVVDPHQRKAWVPTRFDRVSVWHDGAVITDATILVERDNAQSKTVTIWLRDAQGSVVARLDRALLRPVLLSQGSVDDTFLHVLQTVCGGSSTSAIFDRIAAGLAQRPAQPPSEGWPLLRAHMRSRAFEVLAQLTDADGLFDLAGLVARGRIAPGALPFVKLLVRELQAGGLLDSHGDAGHLLIKHQDLPASDLILSTFAADYPLAATDLILSAQAAASLESFMATGEAVSVRAAILGRHETASLLTAPMQDALVEAVLAAGQAGRDVPHILLAEPGSGGILARLLPHSFGDRIRITVASTDGAALERLVRRLPENSRVETLDLTNAKGRVGADIGVALFMPFSTAQCDMMLAELTDQLGDGASVLIGLPIADPVVHFQHGMTMSEGGLPPSLTNVRRRLKDLGCQDLREFGVIENGHVILLAKQPQRAEAASIVARVVSADGESSPVACAFGEIVARSISDAPTDEKDVVFFAASGLSNHVRLTREAIEALRDQLLILSAQRRPPRLWIITSGFAGSTANPVADALWAFGRVAMNEYPMIDIRLADIDPAVGPEQGAALLANALASVGNEREVHLGGDGRSVVRVRRGLPVLSRGATDQSAIALDFPRRGILENFHWVHKDRIMPQAKEIEIEILASGLNFRDVMLAMGLLNDDVLDDGMAGAVYGFECAGRVVAVGEGVCTHRIGDLVFGFGKEAFATHVTGPAISFAALPQGISAEAGATIPVAFYTAWYSLVEMARLRAGEKVLIHGGAGSVGLAAIQVARAIGAEIVATVSTPDKEAVARLYGANHVFDSRSLSFADDIREKLGGVDVVLNSVAGEAMRAGLKCLKPFGRFVELGKRDYVENTQVGLRPFRRNLSYFGIDVDQLLAVDPVITERGLAEVVAGFADGSYMPLPTLCFEAFEIGSAFRLMQSAGHIGKIVVRPPASSIGDVVAPRDGRFVPGDGVQLVVGGTGGFGLATAFWLADQGARKIVVASRTGNVAIQQQPRIEALRASGISFVVEQVDAVSIDSVNALVARVVKNLGPITGLFHTAMVLDDKLISDLSPEQIERVLAPKVDGANNLDRATRDQPIEHFVLFSSASALIGNPGQGAYAAANGYLQGLARRRREEGLPALAVAWGAITDVGILADRHDTQDSLKRISGMAGMRSQDALALLERALVYGDDLREPVLVCAEMQRDARLRNLSIVATPAFASIFGGHGMASVEGIDLAAQIAGKSDAEAQRILTRVIAEEVAQILRLSVGEVDLGRSLDELGMDSLMALELRMGLETRYNIELPVMSIAAVANLRDLGRRLLLSMRPDQSEEPGHFTSEERALIAIHSNSDATLETAAIIIEPRDLKTAAR